MSPKQAHLTTSCPKPYWDKIGAFSRFTGFILIIIKNNNMDTQKDQIFQAIPETMRIDAPEGTKVKITTDERGTVVNGSDSDKAKVAEYLECNKVYTVLKTVIHGWSTDVYLTELGMNFPFNSVNFYEVE